MIRVHLVKPGVLEPCVFCKQVPHNARNVAWNDDPFQVVRLITSGPELWGLCTPGMQAVLEVTYT